MDTLGDVGRTSCSEREAEYLKRIIKFVKGSKINGSDTKQIKCVRNLS